MTSNQTKPVNGLSKPARVQNKNGQTIVGAASISKNETTPPTNEGGELAALETQLGHRPHAGAVANMISQMLSDDLLLTEHRHGTKICSH
jgi:hypothetical protein